MLFTKAQAAEFFDALRKASVEILKHFGLPLDQGSKHYSEWKHGHPVGVTEHFTAGVTWKGSVRWLNAGGNKNSVSCQMLILDRMLPEVAAIYAKYPPLSELQVVVILMSDGIIPCWHAGWVNRLNFGIENRNAGILRGDQGDWRWWAKGWKAKFPFESLNKMPVNLDGHWWEPYTHGQVVANIIVCQMLYCLYEGDMDPRWFLPHSATTGSKWDTGRAYPLNDVREAVFHQQAVDELIWLQNFKADPQYMDDYDEEEDAEFLQELAIRQADRDGDEDWDEDLVVLEEPPHADLQMLIDDGNWKEELGAIRRGLDRLGYYVPADDSPEMDKDTTLAVYQFQTSIKELKADKVPGSKTQAALVKRLKQFGLWG
jgi:hypothetical protein